MSRHRGIVRRPNGDEREGRSPRRRNGDRGATNSPDAASPVRPDRDGVSGADRSALARLQRTRGNRAVQRMVAADIGRGKDEGDDEADGVDRQRTDTSRATRAVTRVSRHPFRASVDRGPSAVPEHRNSRTTRGSAGTDAAGVARSDAGPGRGTSAGALLSVFERLGSVVGGPPSTDVEGVPPGGVEASEEVDGRPVSVPDVGMPALAAMGRSDPINGTFTYSGSITKGGATPSGFGVTRSFDSRVTGVTITPNSGRFDVRGTFEHPITYQVRSGTGPDGQVDIASPTDSDITGANYPTVVSDLTPNMGDLNGRPPRTAFWAEDLTERHELVHANDDNANGPGAMATVTAWLNGQTAATVGGVRTLLGALPGRFASALLAALSTEAGERRAYGDGAPLYKARADAIKGKGDRGEYPTGGSATGAVLGGLGGAAVGAGIGGLIGGPLGAVAGAAIGGLVGAIGGVFL